jgi:signal transduction histidine kinase
MRRTLKLVDQIMEVNSLESGKVPIDLAVFPLAPMASDFLPSLFSLAAEKEIQLNNDIPIDLPAVIADPELIARVFQNLVGNALKFTPVGGLIRVTATRQGDRIIVYITDTGPGIASEVRDRLFEKFAVGPNRGRGSGLGLAFCKMVIEAQGQEIWVESSSNAGTTFAFSLAVATEANVMESAGAAAPDAAEEQETTL